jgi:putative oxidoreductase
MKFINMISRLFHFPDIGILILRLWVGAIGIFHGAQKLFGVFGGGGMDGFISFLESKSVPFPTLSAYMAGSAEFFGGILIALGIFTRFASFLFAFTMAVAVMTTFNGQFDAREGGLEFQVLIAAACLAIFFNGPGSLSLQALVAKLSGDEKKPA